MPESVCQLIDCRVEGFRDFTAFQMSSNLFSKTKSMISNERLWLKKHFRLNSSIICGPYRLRVLT